MKPLVLCILDGVGIRNESYGNAFKQANKPNFDFLWNKYPHCLLEASGKMVGLPSNQMGNSEVGHMNIGAGRIIYQPLELINNKIDDKTIYKNSNLLEIINHVKENNSALHLFGLLSDGGVHSHIDHLFTLIDMAKENNIEKLYIHAFLDGRDTLPSVALKYLNELEKKLKETNLGIISTLSGRYYAMDRDNRWDRVNLYYNVITEGKGEYYSNYTEAINANYNKNLTDEFVIPCVINKNGIIKENDGLITFNFRPDRLRELFSALTNPSFNGFERKLIPNLKLATMFPVSDEVISKPAYELENFENTLGIVLSKNNKKQLRIAETEKYAHVTYFFDGGKELDLDNCDRVLIPSSKVATYDLKPEMSAYEITDILINKIDNYDVVILNYANGDMVGHTGNMPATIKAVQCLDECLGKLYKKIEDLGGILIITADHGNSDYMLDDEGNVITSHSMSKVPFIICNNQYQLNDGKLADIAPSILKLLNIDIPNEMSGNVLMKDRD